MVGASQELDAEPPNVVIDAHSPSADALRERGPASSAPSTVATVACG